MNAASQPRTPLSRERLLRAAIALADKDGIEQLSMRRLAQELGVVPMALYKHLANKDELLDGMVDLIVGEIEPTVPEGDWKAVMRRRILSAREMLRHHAWASQVIESRRSPTPAVLAYIDSMIGVFRNGGFSLDLTHHAIHAMGSRLLGFSQELFDDTTNTDPQAQAEMLAQFGSTFPHIVELATSVYHDEDSVVGSGCDDQFEFEFALDLLLEGLEKLRQRESTPR